MKDEERELLDQESLFPTPALRDALLARLAFYGVKKVVVSFSGSNDSGQINGVEFEGVEDKDLLAKLEADTIPWREESKKLSERGDKYVTTHAETRMAIPAIIEALCNEASDRAGVDWWNNEGGQGWFSIDMLELSDGLPHIQYHVEENITHTESHDFDHT